MSCDWKGNPCVIFKQDIYTSFHFCLLSLRETSHQLPLLVLDRKRTRLTEQISVSCDVGKATPVSFSYKLLTYNISFLFTFIKRYVTSASLACAGQKEDSVDTLFPTAKVICTMPLYKYATKFQWNQTRQTIKSHMQTLALNLMRSPTTMPDIVRKGRP